MMNLYEKIIANTEESGARMDEEEKVRRPAKADLDNLALSLASDFVGSKETNNSGDARQDFRKLSAIIRQLFDDRSFFNFFFRDAGRLGRTTFLESRFDQILTDLATVPMLNSRVSNPILVIVPHWNHSHGDYFFLQKLLFLLGFSNIRLTLPGHGARSRDTARIVSDFVSADVVQTINCVRLAVLELRSVVTALTTFGYNNIFVLGVSLGSCIAFLGATFDIRISGLSLLLPAGSFTDVVLTGRATRHIAEELRDVTSRTDLRDIWSIISPCAFLGEFSARKIPLKIISATHDKVVLPGLTREFVDQLIDAGCNVDWTKVPCGHYTMARFPFNIAVLFRIVRFISRYGEGGKPLA